MDLSDLTTIFEPFFLFLHVFACLEEVYVHDGPSFVGFAEIQFLKNLLLVVRKSVRLIDDPSQVKGLLDVLLEVLIGLSGFLYGFGEAAALGQLLEELGVVVREVELSLKRGIQA